MRTSQAIKMKTIRLCVLWLRAHDPVVVFSGMPRIVVETIVALPVTVGLRPVVKPHRNDVPYLPQTLGVQVIMNDCDHELAAGHLNDRLSHVAIALLLWRPGLA